MKKHMVDKIDYLMAQCMSVSAKTVAVEMALLDFIEKHHPNEMQEIKDKIKSRFDKFSEILVLSCPALTEAEKSIVLGMIRGGDQN
jgi:hypothetical protein